MKYSVLLTLLAVLLVTETEATSSKLTVKSPDGSADDTDDDHVGDDHDGDYHDDDDCDRNDSGEIDCYDHDHDDDGHYTGPASRADNFMDLIMSSVDIGEFFQTFFADPIKYLLKW
eukprot:CAMPEP_0168611054 /NCGR_PEP_ID=MMETSP0449_2-20121227/2138_1 /TAXON_ID=1082188 /ORGANISM="Strombidium rassoulzadegani, Strain ras09" /LENGTH=115 /DNA_ID=CAMNT_0008651445 /DNA_START=38 /DNA_END=382 /DNA_ORIENTATION=+